MCQSIRHHQLFVHKALSCFAHQVLNFYLKMTHNHCSSTEKIKMIELNAFGDSVDEIGDAAGRDQRTVRRWLQRWRSEGTIDVRPRSGRPLQLSHQDQAKLLAFVLRNPTSTLREIKTTLEFTCTRRTIDNFLKRN